MKKLIFTLAVIYFACNITVAQNASTYFPAATGYKWYYKNIPLDSNNVPQQNLARYRVDSFAVVADYKGLLASTVRKKDNLLTLTQNTPYNDTSRYNFQTTNGWSYVSLAAFADTIPLPGLIGFILSLQNWYNVFRFAQTVNSEYTIVSKDTTISIDTISLPLRVKLKAKRLNDEVVPTVNGNFNSKKFVLTYGLYLRVFILEYPIIERPDTTWISEGKWMVKEVIPSVSIDLSTIGIPISIPIPGNIYELTNPPIGIRNISSEVPAEYSLYQNYPNPFNPATTIKFQISKTGITTLKVFDMTGKEVSNLLNKSLQPGTYEINFNAGGLTSGVYFYRLKSGDFTETKKLSVVK